MENTQMPFSKDVEQLNNRVIALREEILAELKSKYPNDGLEFVFAEVYNDKYIGVNIDAKKYNPLQG